MQFPITVGLHRSSFLGLAIALVHLLASVIALVPPWSEGLKAIILTGVVASAVLAWRCRSPRIESLRLLGDGRMECRLAGQSTFNEAELLPTATVHPWLTVVYMKVAGRKETVVVLPDGMRPEDFRRLRVWLRWRAVFSGAKNAA